MRDIVSSAPERDVVRVEERTGPRGGRVLVLHLSCGCFLTRVNRLPPPKKARCIPCSVYGARTDVERAILKRMIEIAVDGALGEVVRQCGSIGEQIMKEARGTGISQAMGFLCSAANLDTGADEPAFAAARVIAHRAKLDDEGD